MTVEQPRGSVEKLCPSEVTRVLALLPRNTVKAAEEFSEGKHKTPKIFSYFSKL